MGGTHASTIACLRCKKGFSIPRESSWTCNVCQHQTKEEMATRLIEGFMKKMAQTQTLQGLETLLASAVKIFHPTNYVPLMIRIKLNTLLASMLDAENVDIKIVERRKSLLEE